MKRTDEQLLDAYLRGSERALGILFKRYRLRLYTAAVSRLKNKHLADDIVQNTFIKCMRYADRFDSALSTFEDWISCRLNECIIDEFRSSNHRRMMCATDLPIRSGTGIALLNLRTKLLDPIDHRVDDPSIELHDKEFTAAFWSFVDELPNDLYDAFCLVFLDGYTYSQAAATTGIPHSTIHYRMGTLKGRLRDCLQNHRVGKLVSLRQRYSLAA